MTVQALSLQTPGHPKKSTLAVAPLLDAPYTPTSPQPQSSAKINRNEGCFDSFVPVPGGRSAAAAAAATAIATAAAMSWSINLGAERAEGKCALQRDSDALGAARVARGLW